MIRAVRSVMMRSKQLVQSLFGVLLVLNISACIVFASASYRNYPGGDAIVALQDSKPLYCVTSSPCRIHVDPASAMTGVSRFLQYSNEMMFDKNESENIDFLQYDFLITATPTKQGIVSAFQIHTIIEKFHRVDWRTWCSSAKRENFNKYPSLPTALRCQKYSKNKLSLSLLAFSLSI